MNMAEIVGIFKIEENYKLNDQCLFTTWDMCQASLSVKEHLETEKLHLLCIHIF